MPPASAADTSVASSDQTSGWGANKSRRAGDGMGSTAGGPSGNREPRTRDHGNMPQNGTVENPPNANQLTYVHIYIYIDLDIDIYTYTYIYMYLCVFKYVWIHTCTYTRQHIHTYVLLFWFVFQRLATCRCLTDSEMCRHKQWC